MGWLKIVDAAALMVGAWLIAAAAPPREQDAAVARAEDRGTTMFWYDRAAWVSTDDMTARLPPDRLADIGGWVVTPAGPGYHVAYFGKAGMADRVLYEVDIQGPASSNARTYTDDKAPRLEGAASRMAAALLAARAELGRHADWQSCTDGPFNTIVLPPDRDGTIPVYFLTPQIDWVEVPLGGHYEVDIDASGTVRSTRGFTRACFNVPMQADVAGKKAGSFWMTHLLDPQPTEVHVFEQFSMAMPLFVGITEPKSVWKVENGHITRANEAALD